MKQSNVKGKVFIPKYIARNTKVQQIFHAEATHKHTSHKSIKLSEISPTMRERIGQVRPSIQM